ncbi:hypothetical protein D9M70_288650 [compost metagenome]
MSDIEAVVPCTDVSIFRQIGQRMATGERTTHVLDIELGTQVEALVTDRQGIAVDVAATDDLDREDICRVAGTVYAAGEGVGAGLVESEGVTADAIEGIGVDIGALGIDRSSGGGGDRCQQVLPFGEVAVYAESRALDSAAMAF